MKLFLKILRAAAISVALFCFGVVLASIIYTGEPPEWYGFAVYIVPFVVFIVLIVNAFKHRRPSTTMTTHFVSVSDTDTTSPANMPCQQDDFKEYESSDCDVSDDISLDDSAQDMTEYPDYSGSFLHISGLPLLRGTFCTVSHYQDRITIHSPTHRHSLSVHKIDNISILSYRDMVTLRDTLLTSSTPNAATQTLNDAIDISAKKKHLSPDTQFLIIKYHDDASAAHSIIFQLNDGNLRVANNFAASYGIKVRPHIDL